MKKLFKNKIFYLLSFLIPIIVMLLAFFVKDVWFDGERLAFGDMQAQYSELLLYFKKIISGNESIIYSITKGLGGDMYATTMYYMLSPFNIITLFFKDGNIMQAVYLIILGKIGLCGLTMFTYLKYRKIDDIKALMFSLCFALMAFIVDSYFCVMWMDSVYMTPLIIMGIDKLIDEKKVCFYIVSLALGILFNFYMGYMICLFSIIYFVYRLCLKYKLNQKKEIKDSIIRFIVSTFLSGLVTAFVWLPSIIEILKTNREGLGTSTNIVKTIKALFIGSYTQDNILNYYQPNLYCGTIILVLIVSFLVSKKNTNLNKGLVMTIITLFVASIFVPFLSYIWHGFSYPIGYNYRFTYILCLFLIIIASQELEHIDYLGKKQKLVLVILGILIVVFTKKYFNDAWISLIFLIIYMLVLSLKINKDIRNYILCFFVLVELTVNCIMSFYPAFNATRYSNYYNDICINLPKGNNYRVSGNDYFGTDELVGCGVSSTKGFYSTLNNNISTFYGRVGFTGGANVYDENQNNTPIIYDLLGVKYIYGRYRINNYDLLKEILIKRYDHNSRKYYEDKIYMYENKNALSFGYMIDDVKKLNNLNPFQYQNELLKAISGSDVDILREVKNKATNDNLSNSKYIYLLTTDFMGQGNSLEYSINGVAYTGLQTGQIFKVENNFNSDYIEINSNYNIMAYYVDMENYENAINTLKQNSLKNVKVNKSVITGNIDLDENGTLMLSIPYEDGLYVYVDGIRVKTKQIYDMFIGVELKKGNHNIKIQYKNNNIIYGAIISILSGLVIVYFVKENNNENKKSDEESNKEKVNNEKVRKRKSSKK